MVTQARVRFKPEDIWNAPEDGNRYEVIDGELYVSPAPAWRHQGGVAALVGILWPFVRAHDLGHVVPAPVGVVLNPLDTAVEPDVVFLSRARAHLISDRGIEGAPDLVVEVLSPGNAAYDRDLKMRRYARAGIPHYWIVDPRTRVLEAYRLEGDAYLLVGTYAATDVFRPELFPGLEIRIADLWV